MYNHLVFNGEFVDDFTYAKTWSNGDAIPTMTSKAFTYLPSGEKCPFRRCQPKSFECVSLGSVQELLLLFEREFFNVDGRRPQVFVPHETLNLPIISAGFSSPVCSEACTLTMIM